MLWLNPSTCMFIYVLYVLYDQISLVQDTKHVETPAPAPSCGIGWFIIRIAVEKTHGFTVICSTNPVTNSQTHWVFPRKVRSIHCVPMFSHKTWWFLVVNQSMKIPGLSHNLMMFCPTLPWCGWSSCSPSQNNNKLELLHIFRWDFHRCSIYIYLYYILIQSDG